MTKPRLTRIFLTTLLSIWLWPSFAAADGTTAGVKNKRPLDNRELHQLRKEFEGRNKPVKLRGTIVRVRVVISTLQIQYQGNFRDHNPPPYQKVMAKVLKPDKGSWNSCDARLISARRNSFINLKEGEEYWVVGMIMENDYDDGHFWIYAGSLTKIEQPGGGPPTYAWRSNREAEAGPEALVARIEAEAANVTTPMPIQEPLDNRELHRLRLALSLNDERRGGPVTLWGTEVEARVVISQIQYEGGYTPGYCPPFQKVVCKVLQPEKGKPDKGRWFTYRFSLINLKPGFYSDLKKGEEYLLKGIFVTGRSCYGYGDVYANKLTKVEQ